LIYEHVSNELEHLVWVEDADYLLEDSVFDLLQVEEVIDKAEH